MAPYQEPHEAIRDIRNMMERSSRFLSLSGLAGVIIGILAITGTAAVYLYFDISPIEPVYLAPVINKNGQNNDAFLVFLLSDAVIVLLAALATGCWMAMHKAKKRQLPIWDATAKRLLINMLIPLAAGGLYCLILLMHGHIEWLAPVTLMFYGLALVNASKYTIEDIRTLGIWEIIAGLLSAYFIEYGLLFWAAGFGLLHIIYGTTIYAKYEK